MALQQRPLIGLKDVVYAVLTESTDTIGGTPSWGTVYPLANSVDLIFDPAASSTTLFADDGAAFTANTTGDMTVSLTNADILPQDYARILGETYSNGIRTSNTLDQAPYIAIGGKKLRSGTDSGNLVYDYVWYLKCKFQKPKQEGKTKEATISYQTQMLEGRVVKLTATNNYQTVLRTDDPNATYTTITNFFNAPVAGSTVDLGALTGAIAKASTNVSFTFTKAGGGLITLPQSNLTTATLPVWKSGVLQAGAYVITNNGTATVTVTFTPSVAFGTATVSASIGYQSVYDQNGVFAGAANAVLTYP